MLARETVLSPSAMMYCKGLRAESSDAKAQMRRGIRVGGDAYLLSRRGVSRSPCQVFAHESSAPSEVYLAGTYSVLGVECEYCHNQ